MYFVSPIFLQDKREVIYEAKSGYTKINKNIDAVPIEYHEKLFFLLKHNEEATNLRVNVIKYVNGKINENISLR